MRRAKSKKQPWQLWSSNDSSRLCGAHFEDENFVAPSPNFAKTIGFVPKSYNLKTGAIPTIFERPTTPSASEPTAKKTPKPRSAYEKRGVFFYVYMWFMKYIYCDFAKDH